MPTDRVQPWHPVSLDFVYQRAGVAAPIVRGIGPDELPPPYRSLLAHQRNMTLTLERHFGRLVLRTLSTFIRRPWYFRRVLLVQENSGRPVEMGAIRVNLNALRRASGSKSSATRRRLAAC